MMNSNYTYLEKYWLSGAMFMAAALLLISPLLFDLWPTSLLLIFLHSPVYMLHQLEEHTGDCFRTYVNQRLCGGRDGLTTFDVVWINVGAVWGLNLAALYVGHFGDIGWALIAPYLMVVNAASHIGWAIRFRRYNPGLATSVLLFLPLGAITLHTVPASLIHHLAGFGLAVILHAAIILNLVRRLRLTTPS